MKKLLWALTVPMLALAEEHGGSEDFTFLKWLYAGILIALVVWAWSKFVTPALRARGETIRKDLDTARKMKAESDLRVQEIETRLGNLSGEVENFRLEAQQLIEAEGQKIREETADQTARLRQRTAREIESLTKGAIATIRAEASRQAIELARQKLAQDLPPQTHRQLIAGFLQDLERSRN